VGASFKRAKHKEITGLPPGEGNWDGRGTNISGRREAKGGDSRGKTSYR